MSYLTNLDGTRFYYKDAGQGPVVLLVQPWALDSSIWEYQVPALVAAGHRCVAMDRRGHGRSDEPGRGYDLDTLADDLAMLLEHLDLHDVSALGHSMGCCEITRYLSRHGSERVSRAMFLGTQTPYVKGAVGADAYEDLIAEFADDRPHWFEVRKHAYFAMPDSGVSQALADEAVSVALRSPMEVLIACQRAGTSTDLTTDLAGLDIPVLLVHGDADQSAPLEITGRPTAELIPNSRLVIYPGAPHGLYVTHRHQLAKELLAFMCGQRSG